jgi:ssDNA-binding Zn-finger/Zn-ribbon topoisomerase 1
MPFTTVCVACATVFRLLDRYRGCKVMCPECRKPFLARSSREKEVEVADGDGDELPSEGWLVVCPSCGHTGILAVGPEAQEALCSKCGAALTPPRSASKRIRRRDAT